MATEMLDSTSVTVHRQETCVTRETRMEIYNSDEEEKMGNKEKMRFLNNRFLCILEQKNIQKLQGIESMLQVEFKSVASKINENYKSKLEEIWIRKEENTMLVQEKTRLETKVKELSMTLKTVTEELEATRQSLHQYEKSITEKDLKITEQEGQVQLYENKYCLADEQSKQNQKRIEELIDIVERNKIKQQQDQIRIESLDEQLEFRITLNQEVKETGRSENTINKYLKEAKSELQMLMMKIKQSYDTALKDYIDKQKVFYAKKVDSLVQETSRNFKSMQIEIQEDNKRTTTDIVEGSFAQQEDFLRLKNDNATLYKQALNLQKENARLETEIDGLRSHENVICQKYHETSELMVKSFIKKTEEIIERRFTEDCQLTPEIEIYKTCISNTEQILGIQSTDQVFIFDENLEMKEIEFRSVKTELMRSSSVANGDKNDKDVLDDGKEY